ncbi:MAG TPA: hypothetical protein VK919_07310 [Solirubrobacterales bacterium]|nr:hypothetical protein [Solirubrobacterales bacterium]
MTIACRNISPSARTRSEHLRKKVSKYCQPTASIISIETRRS